MENRIAPFGQSQVGSHFLGILSNLLGKECEVAKRLKGIPDLVNHFKCKLANGRPDFRLT